jgi:hypothetical protein
VTVVPVSNCTPLSSAILCPEQETEANGRKKQRRLTASAPGTILTFTVSPPFADTLPELQYHLQERSPDDLRRRVIAGEHDVQSRRAAVGRTKSGDPRGQFPADRRRCCRTVEALCAHA